SPNDGFSQVPLSFFLINLKNMNGSVFKELCKKIPDDEILSREEMDGILGEFEELKDSKKAKKLYDSFFEDLDV
ncbi:hypothetical protein LCGC14_1693250, partial [marine sediment metagenome]